MNSQDNSPSMTEKLILFFVIRTKGHITKTQLVKFIYLADLYSVKWLGKQITNLNWYYFNHGPWEQDIQNCLKKMDGKQIQQIHGSGNSILIKPGLEVPSESDLSLSESIALMLENIRKEWAGPGKDKFQSLIDYIYNTAPMKDVLERGLTAKQKEPLNLSIVHDQMKKELEI